MRIAVFHSQFGEVGGAEILALRQARHLLGQGDEVELVTFDCDRERWEDAMSGLPLTILQQEHWRDVLLKWHSKQRIRSRARRVGRDIGKLNPAVILSHNPPSNVLLGLSGVRVHKVWYCHEPPRYLYPRETNRGLLLAIKSGLAGDVSPGLADMMSVQTTLDTKRAKWRSEDQEGVNGLDVILANSEYTRASVESVYGFRDVKVVNPMIPFRDSPRRRFGMDRRGLKVLVQTRMEAIKNVDTILRGFARVRSKLGSEAFLHLVGTGSELPYLQALSRDLNVQDCVRFHGFIGEKDLESVRSACDVFALLPWDEPFGMVYPESAAAGLLMVGSDHGGPQEILDDSRFGWNIPCGPPEVLGETLEKIWALNDAEVNRRKEEANQACRARYSPEVTGLRLRSILRHE